MRDDDECINNDRKQEAITAMSSSEFEENL